VSSKNTSMRFLFFLALFISINTVAQERFNGTIVYRLLLPAEDNMADSSAKLNVFFGPNAIKLTFVENKKTDNEEILVSFDSAKVFVMDFSKKTYSIKEMSKARENQPLPATKKILGYSSTPKQILTNSPFNKLLGGLSGEIIVFVADQLNYYIPDKYAGNDEVIFIHNNKIVLEGKATVTSAMGLGVPDEGMVFKFEAVSVTPQQLDPAIFTIPPGFTKETEWNFATDTTYTIEDSISVTLDTMPGVIDTAVYLQPEKPVKPSKKPVTPKKKQSTTSSTQAKKPD